MSGKKEQAPHPLSKEGRALRDAKEKQEVITNSIMDLDIDSRKIYEFRMTKKSEGVSMIPRSQSAWCEKEGRIREIRYCKLEDSPYVDEQSETAREERLPLTFSKGVLKIDGSNAPAIRYLLASDQIKGKSKILPAHESVKNRYYLVDSESLAKKAWEDQEKEFDARKIIKESTTEDLENFIRSQFRRTFATEDELKVFAVEQVSSHADKFIKTFNNPLHKLKAQVQVLFEKGVLSDTKGVVTLSDTSGQVLTYTPTNPDGTVVRADEALAKWILAGSKDALDFKKSHLEVEAS